MDIHTHLVALAVLGGATLFAAWLPSISERLRVSYTVILLLVGFLVYWLGAPLAWPDPFWPDSWAMTFTEAVVTISLMSAGLKIGRAYTLDHWRGPLRLLLVTMPLCIVAGVLLGHYLVGLPIETAMLLGAVLAPTDPVMAAEVQIEPVETGHGRHFDPIRFTLTGEASLNDGLAYPFTWLAVLLAQAGGMWERIDWTGWVFDKLLLKVGLGLLIGWLFGRAIGWLLEDLPAKLGLRTRDGFVAFAATFLVYATTELLHGYGFLAVFVTGLTIRYMEGTTGDLKLRLHDFVSEIERLMLSVFLIIFGGSIMNGLIGGLDWKPWAFAGIFILLIRPAAGMLALIGTDMSRGQRFAVSFLGIRGIGSIFYLTWAFLQTDFPAHDLVYQTLSVVMVMSLVLHGLTARTLLHIVDPEGDENPSYEVEGAIERRVEKSVESSEAD